MAFLRARDGWPLREVAGDREVHCEQSFAPFAQPLQQAAGWTVSGQLDDVAGKGRYPLVLVLPPRQREEARALFARALALVADGTHRCLPVQQRRCAFGRGRPQAVGRPRWLPDQEPLPRVLDRPLQGQHDVDLAKRWSALDAVRPIVGGRFLSRPGVFAWDRIDPASALLAEHLPADLAGRAADLGAGYGYLSRELLERCPKITALDLYEAEQRALALAELNLAPPPRPLPLRFLWQDVTAGIEPGYDVIISNPPFHTPSRADRPDIGQRFIAVAAQALRPGGRLYVVANRHLPYTPQRQLRRGARGRRTRRFQAGGSSEGKGK